MHLQIHACSPAGVSPRKLSLCRDSVLQCLPRQLCDWAPLCLFPGQWWVSVGTDNLVSIFSMPTGTLAVQVQG